MKDIIDASALRTVYKDPGEGAVNKQLDQLDVHCRRFIELSTMIRMIKDRTGGSEAQSESQEAMQARYRELLY